MWAKWLVMLGLFLATTLFSTAVQANTMVEVWRGDGSFGVPEGLAINPSDNSVWVVQEYDPLFDGWYGVGHLASNGTTLWQSQKGLYDPYCVSVNSRDGSVWIGTHHANVHLSAEGTLLWQGFLSGWDGRISPSIPPTVLAGEQ